MRTVRSEPSSTLYLKYTQFFWGISKKSNFNLTESPTSLIRETSRRSSTSSDQQTETSSELTLVTEPYRTSTEAHHSTTTGLVETHSYGTLSSGTKSNDPDLISTDQTRVASTGIDRTETLETSTFSTGTGSRGTFQTGTIRIQLNIRQTIL